MFLTCRPITPVILDQNYVQLKNQIISAERRILKELGFCVHIKHPHKVFIQIFTFSKINFNVISENYQL